MTRKLMIALAGTAMLAAPATAQNGPLEGRVGKLEGEMRAVQRRVFPGGGATMVEPQITPETVAPSADGVPATSAIADLTSRVSSLEQQMSSMTGQIEQAQHRLRQLEDQFAAFKKSSETQPAPGAAPPLPAVSVPTAPRPAESKPADAAKPVADVAGVEKPTSGDAAEDAYIYGYRLWLAKKYPEAQAQLKKTAADFPKSKRASYAQNLLGRAYLDDGKPSLASIAFYDNYKKYPDGERAPESLYYLGQSLIKLNKPADACKVYGELTDVYGGKISSAMAADVAKARVAAKCK